MKALQHRLSLLTQKNIVDMENPAEYFLNQETMQEEKREIKKPDWTSQSIEKHPLNRTLYYPKAFLKTFNSLGTF